ncbi:MAG TPA: 3-phosphoshikimate 1-carboxyvinyltransferase [Thermoanaerobaculia bacterium]
MDFLVLPRAREVRGEVRVPGSKSATNRALVLAALSEKPVEISGPLESGDTAVLLECLIAMGARGGAGAGGAPDTLRLGGPLGGDRSREIALDAADSGTAARFLAAVCAAVPGRFRLDGSARLRERPMAELVAALASGGAEIACLGRENHLPLAISGGTLRSGALEVDASRSSQFLSALLLAGVAVDGGLTVAASGPVVSSPYVEETLAALAAFGHEVRRDGSSFAVRAGERGRLARRYEVPGDDSSALPLLAAAGAAGGRVTVRGVRPDSVSADARARAVLERMGIAIASGTDAVTASFAGKRLAAVAADASDFPDAVATLVALAALAEGESRFHGIGHLRLKESDRIAALAALVEAAGGGARAGESELVVSGGLRADGLVRLPTAGDHRIAMAAGLLAIARGDCLIDDPGCVAKSYPGFFRDLTAICRR